MRVLLLTGLLLLAPLAMAQGAPLHDREVTWRSYDVGHERSARVRVFACEDERRPHTVVIDDRAGNGRQPVTDEAPYVAETIAREIGFDPTAATFVFRFTEGSFVDGGTDRGKALLVKATFRRTASGSLGSPSWRVISPDALEDLTDRAMR
ncbi:MAG TPA: hypothetical protein EYQ24_13930 [Bacteroidetes bacterium]|nr:hypothetical protein [Bacteroidota bacterium]